MISVWHLLWVVPLSFSAGLVMAVLLRMMGGDK